MDGGTLTVDQNGFLTGSKGIDGAAINAQKATIIIDGNAVIAGNMVADDNNGGAIWIDKSDLTIQGKALLAANQAGERCLPTRPRAIWPGCATAGPSTSTRNRT